MPNLDFSMDPSFQAGPQANYPAAINYPPPEEPPINYFSETTKEPPINYFSETTKEPPRYFEPPPSSGLTDFEKDEFDRKTRPPMPTREPAPIISRPNDTGFLPDGPIRDFYRGLISREEMDSRLASKPYKAGGRVAPIKRMTGGRSVKC